MTERYPDEETRLAVDDEDDPETETETVATAGGGTTEQDAEHSQEHTYGANSRAVAEGRREVLNAQSEGESESDSTETSTDESSDRAQGFLDDGLTKNELIAFVGGFTASYALAAVFYWGIITTSGFDSVPLPMWILLGVVVVAPLALMFGLKETSTLADTVFNRASR